MISHKHKFIFVHPNKCGGNSIEYFFQGYLKVDHTTLVDYQKKFAKVYENYFKFGFSRNPFDRLVSVYYGRIQGRAMHRKPDKELAENTFSESVKLGNRGVMANCKLMTEKWFTNKKGNVDLDFIGRFENYQEDFNTVCDKIGVPRKQLPHENKSKHKHYTEYYDDETREIVAEKYAKDIEYFGYKFGE
jgi:chondroitin 4-sulfotransferase 11